MVSGLLGRSRRSDGPAFKGISMRLTRGLFRLWVVASIPCISIAQSAEPVSLTLACQGTASIKRFYGSDYDPVPISMGLIVNFMNRTVKGTARWGPYLFDDEIPIMQSNENMVTFNGFSKFLGMLISGYMDRVTGDVVIQATEKDGEITYALKCKPTQRMF
jgi:hypothetical protein